MVSGIVAANLWAGVAGAVVLAADLWHARRVRRLGRLTFGDRGAPLLWWLSVPLRALGVAAIVWGAAVLLMLQPKRVEAQATPAEKDFRRLLIVADVSPSMQLADAGPDRRLRRSRRGGDVVVDLLGRIALGQCKASVVAFYSGAKPVAVDVVDRAVLDNIFRDLPLDQAFEPGPSELFKGLDEAFKLAAPWPAKSATLVVLSDGDVAPATGMPQRPASIGDVLVIGVGDTGQGSSIAGRQSRQDAAALQQIANRLGGRYANCNVAPLPASALGMLAQALPERNAEAAGLREAAIACVAAGGAAVAIVPVGLSFLAAFCRRPARLRAPTASSAWSSEPA